jgi:hypothetical protein
VHGAIPDGPRATEPGFWGHTQAELDLRSQLNDPSIPSVPVLSPTQAELDLRAGSTTLPSLRCRFCPPPKPSSSYQPGLIGLHLLPNGFFLQAFVPGITSNRFMFAPSRSVDSLS